MSERIEEQVNESAVTVTATQVHQPGLDVVEILSDLYDEPDWMRQSRRDAWQQYEAMSFPLAQEEAWRRTDLKKYPLEDYPLD